MQISSLWLFYNRFYVGLLSGSDLYRLCRGRELSCTMNSLYEKNLQLVFAIAYVYIWHMLHFVCVCVFVCLCIRLCACAPFSVCVCCSVFVWSCNCTEMSLDPRSSRSVKPNPSLFLFLCDMDGKCMVWESIWKYGDDLKSNNVFEIITWDERKKNVIS